MHDTQFATLMFQLVLGAILLLISVTLKGEDLYGARSIIILLCGACWGLICVEAFFIHNYPAVYAQPGAFSPILVAVLDFVGLSAWTLLTYNVAKRIEKNRVRMVSLR